VTLVAGPGLRHARAENNELPALFPEATVLTGKVASAEVKLAAAAARRSRTSLATGASRSDSPPSRPWSWRTAL
jgi:hypothetical protein